MSVKKILICADNHGNHAEPRAVEALLAFKKDYKPDTLVHLGDAIDLACLRRGASNEDMGVSLKQDFDEGCQFLRDYFSGSAKDKIFLFGNHDQRLLDAMGSHAAMIADHATTLYEEFVSCLNRCGVNKTDVFYDSRLGVVDFYPFRFIHGYSTAENAAKAHAMAYGGKCPAVIFGHTHYRDYWRASTLDRQEAWGCSCLCGIDPDYARKNIRKLRHSIGFIYGWYDDKSGAYQLNHVEGIDKGGKMVFVATTKLKEY